jgi:hypothetical protein
MRHLRPAPPNVSQATQEDDELSRITITNEKAMTVASKQTHGHMQSPEQKSRIDMWVERLPYHWQLEDVSTARSFTDAVYMDRLHWERLDALSWIARLNDLEKRYRVIGIDYHKIPYSLRHSETLLHGPKIGKPNIVRLSQVFETGRPREQQAFFNVATDVIGKVDECGSTTKAIDELRRLCLESGIVFRKSWKQLDNLEIVLEWAQGAVSDLSGRSDLDGVESLEAKHSREGSLFRRWIQTFPEIQHELVKSKHEYIECWVHQALSDGVEKNEYWTTLAQKRLESGQ